MFVSIVELDDCPISLIVFMLFVLFVIMYCYLCVYLVQAHLVDLDVLPGLLEAVMYLFMYVCTVCTAYVYSLVYSQICVVFIHG